MRLVSAILMSVLALPALADAQESSLRPVARGGVSEVAAEPLRPRARPAAFVPDAVTDPAPMDYSELTSDDLAANTSGVVLAVSTMGKTRSPRPFLRPDHIVKKAMARQRERERGAICGNSDIQGERVGDVPGRIPGCGAPNAVKVRAVSGVTLSQQAIMTCDTAKALNRWVDRDLKRAVGRMGGGVSSLKVAAHYVCRTRNHRAGAKISEHGKGKAIDISEIRLQNGDTLNVLRDWGRGKKGRVLRKAHKAACGTFGTTLGPGSDGYHEDHFHYDTARHRGGPYCR
ncbi:extensin family protein [Primorskyibacter aestuariivivens]|uniref:extensin-like domain-containing protein n=1 Tax=Primorskyibacter aestuariivivens TaxID=1888912 RepID=UPI00230009FF|nr:extensin family protein [Primorskyibacter aestuariivivens]MDA7428233.1 extensin family protein [Primorskyibacter aestuariivivens]